MLWAALRMLWKMTMVSMANFQVNLLAQVLNGLFRDLQA
jgi:hypothetical protein